MAIARYWDRYQSRWLAVANWVGPDDMPQPVTVFFHNDTFLSPADSGDIYLTWVPILHSEHVYRNGMYQAEGLSWTRTDDTSNIIQILPEMGLMDGDLLIVEYAYHEQEAPPPPPDPDAPICMLPMPMVAAAGDANLVKLPIIYPVTGTEIGAYWLPPAGNSPYPDQDFPFDLPEGWQYGDGTAWLAGWGTGVNNDAPTTPLHPTPPVVTPDTSLPAEGWDYARKISWASETSAFKGRTSLELLTADHRAKWSMATMIGGHTYFSIPTATPPMLNAPGNNEIPEFSFSFNGGGVADSGDGYTFRVAVEYYRNNDGNWYLSVTTPGGGSMSANLDVSFPEFDSLNPYSPGQHVIGFYVSKTDSGFTDFYVVVDGATATFDGGWFNLGFLADALMPYYQPRLAVDLEVYTSANTPLSVVTQLMTVYTDVPYCTWTPQQEGPN